MPSCCCGRERSHRGKGANLFVGWLGGLLEKMPATSFWLLHAGLVAAAGMIFFLVRPLFRGALA
jgi:POT family proton-dependent oligopeptide transporter